MDCIGRGISLFCRVGGWFFPMYGAGLLESQNIREYQHGARLAHGAGCGALAEEFVVMAVVARNEKRIDPVHIPWLVR